MLHTDPIRYREYLDWITPQLYRPENYLFLCRTPDQRRAIGITELRFWGDVAEFTVIFREARQHHRSIVHAGMATVYYALKHTGCSAMIFYFAPANQPAMELIGRFAKQVDSDRAGMIKLHATRAELEGNESLTRFIQYCTQGIQILQWNPPRD
jgi:hypothetical protein